MERAWRNYLTQIKRVQVSRGTSRLICNVYEDESALSIEEVS